MRTSPRHCVLLLLFQCLLMPVVFGQFSLLHAFSNLPVDGHSPTGSLVSDGTYLYGMASSGGAHNSGIVFRILPGGNGYTVLHHFDPNTNFDGRSPFGSLTFDGTSLYGLTYNGGANDNGILFKMQPDGSAFTKLHDFADATGSNPAGSLILESGYLFGMTRNGGAHSAGTVFRIQPDGNGYQDIYDFDGSTTGANPMGDLVSDAMFLYGMTSMGGTNNFGTIFRMQFDGSGYLKLFDFDGAVSGKFPQGSLLYMAPKLYGMTKQGGAMNVGVIFQINPSGSGFQVVYDFLNGNPYGSLIADGTHFYGMSHDGGSDMVGSVFAVAHDGSGYQDLVEFNVQNGSYPNGSLLLDGSALYGLTIGGGVNNLGTLFKYALAPNAVTPDQDRRLGIWPNPSNGQFTVATPAASGWVRVVDACGVPVWQTDVRGARVTLDLRALPKGVYDLEVWDGAALRCGKVVLE